MSARPLGPNESLVLAVLSRAARPLGAYQILDETRAHGMRAPQQVYRALERLVAGDLVHRIESLNAYQPCRHGPQRHHAAFAICKRCGSAAEFPHQAILPELEQAAGALAFAVDSVRIELSGTCSGCKTATGM